MQAKLREPSVLVSRTTRSAVPPNELQVPVRLGWDDESGNRVNVVARTRVVNLTGAWSFCRSRSTRQRLALTNLVSDTSNAAIIVWRQPAPGRLGIWRRAGRAGKWISGVWTCETHFTRENLRRTRNRFDKRGASRQRGSLRLKSAARAQRVLLRNARGRPPSKNPSQSRDTHTVSASRP